MYQWIALCIVLCLNSSILGADTTGCSSAQFSNNVQQTALIEAWLERHKQNPPVGYTFMLAAKTHDEQYVVAYYKITKRWAAYDHSLEWPSHSTPLGFDRGEGSLKINMGSLDALKEVILYSSTCSMNIFPDRTVFTFARALLAPPHCQEFKPISPVDRLRRPKATQRLLKALHDSAAKFRYERSNDNERALLAVQDYDELLCWEDYSKIPKEAWLELYL